MFILGGNGVFECFDFSSADAELLAQLLKVPLTQTKKGEKNIQIFDREVLSGPRILFFVIVCYGREVRRN